MSTYVYRLDITYPPGSLEYGWAPEGWEPRDPLAKALGLPPKAFRWPRERRFLSKKGAEYLAVLFRKYGATVEIQRSEAVSWPGDAG